MKHNPFRSDLRVCAPGEPKTELADLASGMFRRSTKTGNVLSAIESQGFRLRRASATGYLKLMPDPSGIAQQSLKDTSSRKSASKRTKGQPEGSAVTGKTRKPRVAESNLVLEDAAGQNNSNLTSLTALVVIDGWELLLGMVPIIVFIPFHLHIFYTLS